MNTDQFFDDNWRVEFTDEHRLVRDLVARVARDVVAPRAADLDATKEYPWDIVKAYQQHGLMSLTLPEEYGGMNAGAVTMTIAVEEMAKVDGSATLLMLSPNTGPAWSLRSMGSPELRKKYLTRLQQGKLSAFALTEASGGSNVSAVQTKAVRDGDDYVITGSKAFITNGNEADFIEVFAVTDPDAHGPRRVSAFIMDTNSPGFAVDNLWDALGFRGAPLTSISFDGVRVPAGNMLGEEGEGFILAMKLHEKLRSCDAGVALGLGQGALAYAANYVTERHIGSRLEADFQGVQFILADMAINLEAARCLTYKAAFAADQDRDIRFLASMAKIMASDAAMKTTIACVQLLGTHGFLKDHPVERFMRDAKACQIFGGANEALRGLVAKGVLGDYRK